MRKACLTLTVLSLFSEIGYVSRTYSSKGVNSSFHFESMFIWAWLLGFLKMTIAFAKLVPERKLIHNKSNVCLVRYFSGNFLEMLGGIGQIIRHGHEELHHSMLNLFGYHKQLRYKYFHIWHIALSILNHEIMHIYQVCQKSLKWTKKSGFGLNDPWPWYLISMKILMFRWNLILFYVCGIISLNNCPIYKI